LLADLAADFAAITECMFRGRSAIAKRQLAEPAALIAALMAKACTDCGYTREARHSWRAARRLSDLSRSPDVQLWVRGNEAMGGIYQGRPLPVILELIDRGLNLKGSGPSGGRANLLGSKAQTLALMGQSTEAATALRATQRAFEQLPERVTGTGDSVFGWPEQMLRHGESFVYTHLGSTGDAAQAQERALALYPHEQVVSRCQIELHRATCMIRDGYLHEGLDHATATLRALPAQRRQRLVLTVASKILAILPDKERTRPYVAQYRDMLMTNNRRAAGTDHE
jgi:hypothetical protein